MLGLSEIAEEFAGRTGNEQWPRCHIHDVNLPFWDLLWLICSSIVVVVVNRLLLWIGIGRINLLLLFHIMFERR